MLYLIRTFKRGGKSLLKVGYTSNLKSRLDNYFHSNPGYEFLGSRDGDLDDELRLQLYLQLLGFKADILDEWFIDSPEVIVQFHSAQETQKRFLWNGRDLIFGKDSFKIGADKRLRSIYENLREKYADYRYGRGSAEREYMIVKNLELIRKFNAEDLDFLI